MQTEWVIPVLWSFKSFRKWYAFSYYILLGIFLNFVLISDQANDI